MFIDRIATFLPQYQNRMKEDFLIMLRSVNSDSFFELKLEKDFLLTIILIKFGEKYGDLVFK